MAKKKAVSKKKTSKKKVKAAADRRQINVMLEEKAIRKLDKLRSKQSLTRSELITKLIRSAS